MNRIPGIDRSQHRRIVADMHQTHDRERAEPDHHDRPERRRDPRRAAALHREQHDQNENRQRHHIMLERRRAELEALDRRQHRNRRRDHGIADEHRGADDAQRQQWPASSSQRALTERHQRQRASLAVVVGAQQQQHVFCRDDDQERPQDQRQHPEHDGSRDRLALGGGGDRLAERVERRRSDIAKNHANASQRQRPKARRDRPILGFGRCDAKSHRAGERSTD